MRKAKQLWCYIARNQTQDLKHAIPRFCCTTTPQLLLGYIILASKMVDFGHL